jgi:tellurite resistance protein TerC
MENATAWIGFLCFVLVMLGLDLGVFHRKAHAIGFREALGWSAVWLAMGLSFAILVFYAYDQKWWGLGLALDPVDGAINSGYSAAQKYLTGYVVEKSLSVDNIFVIAMIFGSLAVPSMYQHRVLFWGILGAIAMRGVMIVVGARLIAEFHWLLTVFAGFLIFTGVKMLLAKEEHSDPAASGPVRLLRRWLPISERFHGQRFLVPRSAEGGGGSLLMLTPLALALILVEGADLVFAVDSIPAVFAITGDPFLVFTSNVFAILGLRSLYFALAGMVGMFRYLKPALAIVLLVVGGKMLAAETLKHSLGPQFNLYLLGVIVTILATGVIASVITDRRLLARARAGMAGETEASVPVALVLQRSGDDLKPQVVARPLTDDLWRAGNPEAAGLQQR